MNERVLCVLSGLESIAQPYPAFAALIDTIRDAVTASPLFKHVHIYVLDAGRDDTLMQQTELPVPTSFMVSDLRDIVKDKYADDDIVLADTLHDQDGCLWLEYRINTDLFIR